MIKVDLHAPARDPRPEGWPEFRARAGLPGSWDYAVLDAASRTWSPALLGVFRDGPEIVGAVGALYRGLRTSGRPRPRREPLLLDVRLPGEGHGPTWHFTDAVPAAERPRLLRAFERAAARRLGPALAGAVYRPMLADQWPLVERRGALAREAAGLAELPLGWSSADDWLATLGSSRRKSLRRRRRALDRELEVTLGPGLGGADPAEMARLAARHMGERESRFDRRAAPPPSYFAALGRCPDVAFLTYREGGRLLAFGAYLHHPVRPRLSWWSSLPPEEGGRKHLYFDGYLRFVEYALATGGERLSAGRGMADLKREIGFTVAPMRLALVPRWALG